MKNEDDSLPPITNQKLIKVNKFIKEVENYVAPDATLVLQTLPSLKL